MAFAGFNVTFGIMNLNASRETIAPIFGPSTSSNNMLTPGTSSVSAPIVNTATQSAVASVYAAADAWITVGPEPANPATDNPTGGRRFIPAITPVDFLCRPGDKVRWAAA